MKEWEKKQTTVEIRLFFLKRPVFGQNVIPRIEVFDKAPKNEAARAARGKDVHL